MAELTLPAEAERSAVRRNTYMGVSLIALAFIAPVVTVFNRGNAFSVGPDVGRTFGSLLFLALIAWLVTRNRSDLAKARGHVVVGVLLCIVVGNNIVTAAKEEQLGKQFLRDSIAFQAKHASKFEDLDRRFGEVTVNQYLTPQALTSAQAMAAGQAALERYRLLLQERNLLLQTYLSEYVAFVNSIPPGEVRRGAEVAIGPAKQNTEALYKLLDTTQTAHADAIGAVFNWAQANTGRISMRGEQLMFQNAQQQAGLQALANKLQDAENKMNDAAKTAQVEQAKTAAKREQSMKEAEALLSK